MNFILTEWSKIALSTFLKSLKIKENVDYNLTCLSEEELRMLLQNVTITFVASSINRAQSTLICELKDSYIQQSQRYVPVEPGSVYFPSRTDETFKERINYIMNKSINLYNQMTVLKPEAMNKKRHTKDDFEHGIPYEDARYILPLACTTNITITMSCDKLIDLYAMMLEHVTLFNDIFDEIKSQIPEMLHNKLLSIASNKIKIFDRTQNLNMPYKYALEELTPENNVVRISCSTLLNTVIATLTSQGKESPIDEMNRWCEKYEGHVCEKGAELINRVVGYGHTAILEHQYSTFAMTCSLSAYHQVIRHRLQNITRQSILSLIDPESIEFYTPESIKSSIFFKEYQEVLRFWKNLISSYELNDDIDDTELMLALPNATMIKFVVSSNARNDNWIFRERLCMTAQTEIREMYNKKFDMLYAECPEIYKYGIPPCVTTGKCKEGAMSCGHSEEMKTKYSIVTK